MACAGYRTELELVKVGKAATGSRVPASPVGTLWAPPRGSQPCQQGAAPSSTALPMAEATCALL